MIAETRPSAWPGVTAWRSVVVLIVQSIGPAPIRKKQSPASQGDGIQIVRAMTSAAARPVSGPRVMTVPNATARAIGMAASAAASMPKPYAARVKPTPDAERPR